MPSSEALLDTTTLSAIMKGSSRVVDRARAYLNDHRVFNFSIITRYEILRGLKAKDATKQILTFDRFCGASKVLSLTDEIIVRAAEVYSSLKKAGNLFGDADILIGATALVHGLAVATDNEDHFQRIADLRVENWLRD